MNRRERARVAVLLLGLGGAALFLVLLLRHGVTDIAHAVASARWGLALVIGAHLAPLLADTRAWQVLFPQSSRPRLGRLFWMRWISEAINTVIPTAQVGGEIVRARLAATGKDAAPLPAAAASVLGDVTLGVFAQSLFTLSGVALLASVARRSGSVRPVLVGGLVAVLAIGGFYFVQRAGIFRLIGALAARLARSGEWTALRAQGDSIDLAVRSLYARPRALLSNLGWTALSHSLGACEVWIALRVLNVSTPYTTGWILESVGQGIRAVMFVVPAALGVQEGGYLVVGGMLGISPDTALALALIRRVRELAFGVSGVIVWQWMESRRLLRRRTQLAAT